VHLFAKKLTLVIVNLIKSNSYTIHSNDFKMGHIVCLLNAHDKNFMDGNGHSL